MHRYVMEIQDSLQDVSSETNSESLGLISGFVTRAKLRSGFLKGGHVTSAYRRT